MGWLEYQKLLFFLCVFAPLREPFSIAFVSRKGGRAQRWGGWKIRNCCFSCASLREPTSPPKVLLLWQISMWGAGIGSLQLTVEIVILRVDVGG